MRAIGQGTPFRLRHRGNAHYGIGHAGPITILQKNAATVAKKVGGGTSMKPYYGSPACHRFENRQAEPFQSTTKKPGIATCVDVAECLLLRGSRILYPVRKRQ